MRQTRNRNRTIALLIIGGVATILIILVFIVLSGNDQDGQWVISLSGTIQPDQPEEVDITLLDGETINLADYRGQVVVLNFWATWCPPCRAEMPELDIYYREHQADGLVMLAINSGEAPAAARTFFDDFGFVIPVGLDHDGSISDQFGVTGLPVTVVLNTDGTVHYRHTGLITRDVLDTNITPLLATQ